VARRTRRASAAARKAAPTTLAGFSPEGEFAAEPTIKPGLIHHQGHEAHEGSLGELCDLGGASRSYRQAVR
jgi:hypothetical protein